jgi:hypothetical protein
VTRLIGPDEGCRTVFYTSGPNAGTAAAQGEAAIIYTDEALSVLADIITTTGDAIAGSQVMVDAYSRIPLFQYPDGLVDTVWTSIAGGPAVRLDARLDDRLDTLTARVTALEPGGDSAALARSANLSDLADAGTARTNLGLGDSATLDVGTGSGDVAAGDAPAAALAAAAALVDDLSGVTDAPAARAALGLADVYAPLAGMAATSPLPHMYAKLAAINAGTPSRLKILCVGDSYGLKVGQWVYRVAGQMVGGLAGGYYTEHASHNPPGTVGISSSTGSPSTALDAFDVWPSGVAVTVHAGDTATYGVIGGGQFTADTIKVYYALEPAAGTFKLQVDGVDATGFEDVSAVGTLGTLGVATISTTVAQHRVTVVGLTGSMRLVNIGYENSTQSGVCLLAVAQGGISFTSVTSTAWSNFAAWLADCPPDLMLLEAKDPVAGYSTSIDSLLTAATTVPMDVVGIGSTPISTLDDEQVANNATLRTMCGAYGCVYYDTYAIYGSYARLVALGWQGDGTHVTDACDQHRAGLLMRDTGMLAAYGLGLLNGTPRAATLQIGGPTDIAGGLGGGAFGTGLHIVRREPTSGYDMQISAGRWLSLMQNNLTTEVARLDLTGGTPTSTFLPAITRLGSSTGAAIAQDSATVMSVRRGAATGSNCDFKTRGVYVDTATLNNQSGTIVLDCSTGTSFVINLTGDVTTFSFSGVAASGVLIRVAFVQDATGSRLLGGAHASIKWSGAALPVLTTTAGRRDSFIFEPTGGGSYFEVSRSMNVG